MPHQCVSCETTYADGTDQILSGCSDCGGTTFQYLPESALSDTATESPITEAEETPSQEATPSDTPEDETQHSARTDIIDVEEFTPPTQADEAETADPDDSYLGGGVVGGLPDPDMDLDALREELNRQFEGIRILSPGQYEINLTRLFEREECIIALQDDGRYVISIPEELD